MCFLARWVFLFDKVMLLCKKVSYKVRYSPKQVFSVSDIRVEPLQSVHKGKVCLIGG